MKSKLAFSLVCVFLLGLAPCVRAQQHAPVDSSFLARTSLALSDEALNVSLSYYKRGGPVRAVEFSQLYLLLYCEQMERKILDVISESKWTTMPKDEGSSSELFLDVLQDGKLVEVVGNAIAKGVSMSDAPAELRMAPSGYTYTYNFSIGYKQLFGVATELKGFDKKNVVDYKGHKTFGDKLKMIAFVPVNDSKYGNKLPEEVREFDFVNYHDGDTIIHYLKPLAFSLELVETQKGYTVFVN